jgi:hypothetical protein
MDSDEIVKVIAASSAAIVAIIGACYAGARMSLCKVVKCDSCCCNIEVKREVDPTAKV